MPPTSAWWARLTAKPSVGARDERDVRQVRAARVRVVEHVDLARLRVARHHGGDRLGHRAEVHRDVLGLGDHPPALVEERGRAVAPLLDVGGERGADERRAHLLGDRPQRAADNLELESFTLVATVERAMPIPNPLPPGGTQHVAPSSSTTDGPATRSGSAGAEVDVRPGRDVGRAHGDELDRRVAVGVAVALLVRAMEALGEVGAERDGQLERLAAVAQIGLALRAEAAAPRRADRRTTHASRRSSLATSPSAESTPAASGTSTVSMPSSSASAQAWSGPAPPNATSAKSRGSWPRSTETTRSARSISAFTTRSTACGSMPANASLRGCAVEHEPARQLAGRRPSRRFASVTVGRVPPLP